MTRTHRTPVFAIGSLVAVLGTASLTNAQVVRQLTDVKTGTSTVATLDAAGADVYLSSSTNQLGTNSSHAFQLVRFSASTGAGTQLTSATDGIGSDNFGVSVSGDDQWIAFISRDNPTGQNLDRSGEVFVVKSDGTNLQQITNHPGAGLGDALMVSIAGNGTKVAFTSTGNLTGANASHVQQVFVINKDGTGLSQVTHLTDGEFYYLKISDDATKIVFLSEANPLGTNADGNNEIFAIYADGTGLKQLTSTSNPAAGIYWASFAGGGAKVAFAGNIDPLGTNSDLGDEVFVVDYAGTNLKQLTNSTFKGFGSRDSDYAAITGDGLTVYFTSNQATTGQNQHGDWNLWKIKTDGTGLTVLTSNGLYYDSLVVSSSGNRLAFDDSMNDGETKVIDTTGFNLRSLTSTTRYVAKSDSIDGAGDLVAFNSTADLIPGGNPGHTAELFTIHPDGSGLSQLTQGLDIETPGLAGNGATIVFGSFADPLGTNAGHTGQVFRINADGTVLTQVTHGTSGGAYQTVSSSDGSVIVFNSSGDFTGQNADGSDEIFRVNSDGTGLTQITNSSVAGDYSYFDVIDDSGTWVAFEHDTNGGSYTQHIYDIWRVRTDGSGLQAITTGVAGDESMVPDISGDGSLICFSSNKDLTGGNADRNHEIFLWNAGTIRQLTATTEGQSYDCRLSRDGAWVYFASTAPIFEANPNSYYQFYRMNLGTNAIERVEGLGFLAPYGSPARHFDYSFLSVDDTGTRAAFVEPTNDSRNNPDMFSELMLYDYSQAPVLSVSSGPAPTHVSWDVEAGPVRYDVVRGDVANLRVSGTSVDLGAVACVKNDSPVNSTEGSDDGLTPAPGHAFFYVYRGSQGLSAGPGSYGQGSGGKERLAGSGDCQP